MHQGNLVEVLGREVRQGSPGELMVESSPSRQRRPPCETNKRMSDEAADVAALTYLPTWLCARSACSQPSLAQVCGVGVCLGSGYGCAPPLLSGVFRCACLYARPACTPPLLAGVCGMGVCAWARGSAVPCQSWLGCWVLSVFVCAPRLYLATPA